jgi:hypothetical protein
MSAKKYIPYALKLKDPRWQKKRLEVMELNNFTCSGCGETTKTLNVHHPFYEKDKEPWEYQNEILMCVCDDCHKYEHAIEEDIDYYVYLMKTGGFLHPKSKLREVWFLLGMLAGAVTPVDDAIYIATDGAFARGVAKYFEKPVEEILNAVVDKWLPSSIRYQWFVDKWNKRRIAEGDEPLDHPYDFEKDEFL